MKFLSINLLLATVLTGCTTHQPSNTNSITGEAYYRERITMPAGSRLEVLLQDVSLADAAAVELGKFTIEDAGNPPYRFEISYNPADIKPGHRYTVRASLRNADVLIFTSDTFIPVINNGIVSEIQIPMISVARPRP